MAEKESKRTPQKRAFFKNVRIYFREYCNSTSVHGFRYFGEKERSIVEKLNSIWWFVVFAICLTACVFSIYEVYKKWERSPVIVNFANRGTSIENVPFPAVTICPEAKIVGQGIFNYSNLVSRRLTNGTFTPEEKKQLKYMSLICDYNPNMHYGSNNTFSTDFYNFMDLVQPEILLAGCNFATFRGFACSDLFNKIIIDEGICYTFNSLDRTDIFEDSVVHYRDYHKTEQILDWNIDEGYSKSAGAFPYPRRTFSASVTKGLSLNILSPVQDQDRMCKGPVQGYRVLLHAPMDIPRLSQEYFRVPLNQSVVGVVQPVLITTSLSIKKYSAEKRGCYFQEERNLKYFKIYTSENCKLECLTDYTLKICGCVHFFMPRENGTELCGDKQINCMEYVENSIGSFLSTECKCFQSCSDLSYDVTTSQANLEWNQLTFHDMDLSNYNGSLHLTSLTLFFKSDDFITSQRNEFYGPTDFLANFGGLLGLFTGFSVLSLMEILYFLSVRIFCNKRLYETWAGKNEQ